MPLCLIFLNYISAQPCVAQRTTPRSQFFPLTCGFWAVTHLFLRGWQISSQDVIIDTFIAQPEREGALDKNRLGWVVARQGSLLIRTLDSWCGDDNLVMP